MLHIACEHNSNEHPHSPQDNSQGSSHCPVCQKLATSLNTYNIERKIIFIDRPTEQHKVHFQQNVILSGFQPEAISPRGPPA